MSKDFYPYKSGIGLVEPVVIIKQNVCLLLSGKSVYRQIAWFEPIPPFQFLNIGVVPAQTQTGSTSATLLQVNNEEFLQLRWYPLDHAQILLFEPQASGKALLKNIQVPFDDNIVSRDPCLHLTEMYVWQDQNPWFQAINGSDYALNACRLIGFGFRFMTAVLPQVTISAIEAGREPCTYLETTGSSSRPISK